MVPNKFLNCGVEAEVFYQGKKALNNRLLQCYKIEGHGAIRLKKPQTLIFI